MGNSSPKPEKHHTIYRTPSKRWKKKQKPRDYYKSEYCEWFGHVSALLHLMKLKEGSRLLANIG